MNATNTTKQYLKNYDGGILLPYTTLDCILADEESNIAGSKAIVSNILSNDDLLIYEKNTEHNGDKFIHQSNLSGDNLYMLGMYNDGEHNAFIKMHTISDDESSSNQYLGADGAIHNIGNGNGDDIDINQSNLSGLLATTSNPTWFTGKVLFDSSSCSISLDPRLNDKDFYVEGGYLRVRTADHVRQSQVLVDTDTNNPINIGADNDPKLIKFTNGIPKASHATVGDSSCFIYLNDGVFYKSIESIGGIDSSTNGDKSFAPIIMENGVIKTLDVNANLFGGEWTGANPEKSYSLCIRDGRWCINPINVGSKSQLIYLENGTFTASDLTLGEEEQTRKLTPTCLVDGEFVTCDPVGSSEQAIYIDSSGILREVSTMSLQNIKKPTGNNNCVLLSIIDTNNDDTFTNKWSSLNDLLNTHIVGTEIDDDGVKARTLIARPTGASAGKLKVGWEELPHSVKIEENTSADKAFYLTGVFSGTPVPTLSNNPTPEEQMIYDKIVADWNEYHDIPNKLATKLEVAISKFQNIPDESNSNVAINGIYFKNCKLYQTSDARLKTFISDLQDETDLLDHISTIKKGKFYWSSDKNQKVDIGVTAQTVEQYFPELVDEDRGVKTVSYSKLSVVALAAIDKLNDKIKLLEKEIEELKSKK